MIGFTDKATDAKASVKGALQFQGSANFRLRAAKKREGRTAAQLRRMRLWACKGSAEVTAAH